MICDANLRLHGTNAWPNAGGAVSLTAGTAIFSTNAVNLDNLIPATGSSGSTSQMRDIGEGDDLYAVLTVATQVSQATGGTFICDIVATSALDGSGTVAVLGNITVPWVTSNTNLAPGAVFVARINPQLASLGTQYLQGRFNATSNNITAGTVYLDIVTDIYDSKKFYAGGFKVT